ncbi:nitrilase-related carbon-nitrogen hydrolase, partial [Marinovum algicola]|uniref:nitrilase-related carbon-nitrogen hydrolase n=1 Tax=Marinovum algicola TaxID=42444 RepID=UPI0024BBD729
MADTFRITLAQLNPTVGDIAGNAALARDAWAAGKSAGADLVAFPEMFITGYNAQDLVMKPAFHTAAIEAVRALARDCADGPAIAMGAPWVEGAELFNAYLICKGGEIVARGVAKGPEVARILQEVEALWVEERFPPRARVEELLDRARRLEAPHLVHRELVGISKTAHHE